MVGERPKAHRTGGYVRGYNVAVGMGHNAMLTGDRGGGDCFYAR